MKITTDFDGRVNVYCTTQKKWRKVPAIDARDGLEAGLFLLTEPAKDIEPQSVKTPRPRKSKAKAQDAADDTTDGES